MASWALRFVQSLPQVDTVLSGMNSMEQMLDNLQDVSPLIEVEQAAVKQAVAIISAQTAIPCTGCRYCESHCPKKIAIPDYFAMYNEVRRYPADDKEDSARLRSVRLVPRKGVGLHHLQIL